MATVYPRYRFFPQTDQPPQFSHDVAEVFSKHQDLISTVQLPKGLTSDQVLSILRDDLVGLGFEVEAGKKRQQKIERPVFFGGEGVPTLKYEIDAYQADWRCGLEVEAGRAWMGNAIYRDLVQAMVMAQVDVLILAVPQTYNYQSSGKTTASRDYDNSCSVAEALFGHSRFKLPYRLLLIGY